MEGGREQNYWPGFVDALSNVVLTLVFVLVIFVFALVMVSSTVEQRLREQIESNKAAPAQAEKKDISVADKAIEDSKNGAVKVDATTGSISLHFPSTVTDMDATSSDKLAKVHGELKNIYGKYKIVMRSIIGEGSYSTAQRLAYYRAIGVRNYLISTLGESPGNIKISIVRPTEPEEGGRVEIVFQKE